MQYAPFLTVVEQIGGLTPEEAERAIEATLKTLSERITGGEARDIAELLPKGMRGFLAATREPYDLTLRVAELAGMKREQARKATEAVLETLAVRISAGEVEDLRKEIPRNLHHALDRGLRERRDAVPMSVDGFLDHIAEREGISRGDASTTPAPMLASTAWPG